MVEAVTLDADILAEVSFQFLFQRVEHFASSLATRFVILTCGFGRNVFDAVLRQVGRNSGCMPLRAIEAFGELLELGGELVADCILRLLERGLDAGEKLVGRSAEKVGGASCALIGRGIFARKVRLSLRLAASTDASTGQTVPLAGAETTASKPYP